MIVEFGIAALLGLLGLSAASKNKGEIARRAEMREQLGRWVVADAPPQEGVLLLFHPQNVVGEQGWKGLKTAKEFAWQASMNGWFVYGPEKGFEQSPGIFLSRQGGSLYGWVCLYEPQSTGNASLQSGAATMPPPGASSIPIPPPQPVPLPPVPPPPVTGPNPAGGPWPMPTQPAPTTPGQPAAPAALPLDLSVSVNTLANSGELGAVYKMRELAANIRPTNSAWADEIERRAAETYASQRAKNSAQGFSPFKIKSGHIPYRVADHYGGTVPELLNGRALKDWQVGTVWALPLSWDAESKQLAPMLLPKKKSSKKALVNT